jgi:hypothetical protein
MATKATTKAIDQERPKTEPPDQQAIPQEDQPRPADGNPPAEPPPPPGEPQPPPEPSPPDDPEAQRAREAAALLADAGNMVDPDQWGDPTDTTNKIVSSATTAAVGDDRIGVDQRWATPISTIKPTVEPAATSNDWGIELRQVIQAEVAAVFATRGGFTQGTVPFELTPQPPPAPPSFKKHYRCDLSPEIVIQLLDMSALERDERPQANPLPGQYIKFRMGHLYTNDDNVISQLEWMRTRATYSSDMESTLGGNPSIYEDDGSQVYRCPQGCDFYTASKNAFNAHMMGTHQVQVTV